MHYKYNKAYKKSKNNLNKQMIFFKREIKRIIKQWQIDIVIGLKNYIDNNFKEKLNLNLFSRIRFVSKYQLLRLLKKYYGQTPNQYLID